MKSRTNYKNENKDDSFRKQYRVGSSFWQNPLQTNEKKYEEIDQSYHQGTVNATNARSAECASNSLGDHTGTSQEASTTKAINRSALNIITPDVGVLQKRIQWIDLKPDERPIVGLK